MKYRFGIAWRMGLSLAVVGVLASGLTGYWGYSESRKLLRSAAEERLLTATRVLGRQLTVGLGGAAQDVRLIAAHPGTRQLLVSQDVAAVRRGHATLAQLFQSMLGTHPEYYQMRLISARDHGLELVRVDRSSTALLRIDGDDLQEKGHYAYVADTLRLPEGAVYVSRAEINHEVGAHAGLDKPSLQVATPIHDAHGQVLGLIVVNIDLNGLFSQLAADLPSDIRLFLSNGEGDFLIHPDPRQAFAFDRGQRARVQDAFADARTLLSDAREPGTQLVTSSSQPMAEGPLVAAFVRQPLPGLHSEDEFILGLAQPLAAVLADSAHLGRVNLRIVLAFSALAVLIAVVLARALSRPLEQIVQAIRDFGQGQSVGRLPLERRDEIGMLAHSIDEMQHQIRGQFANLAQKQEALDRLASHDTLTGLPNRRLFFDRLHQALARAKRNQTHLALLYIDLDNFKDINDSLGHAAGDAVLCAVGQRLSQLVREADTVARLGGDEFIVLLDGAEDERATELVLQRVREALSRPVRYQRTELQCDGSVGMSRYPDDATEVGDLIAAADHAMYAAKAAGRQRIRISGQAPDSDHAPLG